MFSSGRLIGCGAPRSTWLRQGGQDPRCDSYSDPAGRLSSRAVFSATMRADFSEDVS